MNLRSEFDDENIPDDYLIERMRIARNDLLAALDWTQMSDSPLSTQKKAEWATYRQLLRDFPASWTPGDTAEFPDEPT